jgi:hypothetical protein
MQAFEVDLFINALWLYLTQTMKDLLEGLCGPLIRIAAQAGFWKTETTRVQPLGAETQPLVLFLVYGTVFR